MPNDSVMDLRRVRKLGPLETLQVCYEAGPAGYGLQRFLTDNGVACDVVAPALIPQLRGSRLKTDRRDAVHLAHFLRSGDLTAVWVPDPETEAIRDLVRARDDARLALRRIRQQLLKFLLRHERRFTAAKSHWTKTHLRWIRHQKFTSLAQQLVLEDALRTLEEAEARVRKLVACSPNSDPRGMRVSTAREGKETRDDEAEKKTSHAGANREEASGCGRDVECRQGSGSGAAVSGGE